MTGLLLLYMLAMPFVLQKAAAKTDFRHIAVCAAVVVAAGYFTGHLSYYDRGRMANIFGANNFYYAKSQAMLYTVSQNADFITAGADQPRRLSRIRHFQPQAQMHRIRPARRSGS
ncbi:TPA: LTA synthase family protein, partial [Neisseria meningitidis]